MICPNCFKEINNEAHFCGYCGQSINKEPTQDVSNIVTNISEIPIDSQTEMISNIPQKVEIHPKKRNKHIGLKVLLAISIIAFVAGIVLGLLTAKGIIDITNIFSTNHFEWTDFSEAVDDSDRQLEIEEKEYKEEQASDDTDKQSNNEKKQTTNTTDDFITSVTDTNAKANAIPK